MEIHKLRGGLLTRQNDCVAIEEPLEIRLGHDQGEGRVYKSVAVTMRTPGRDEELAAGFLYSEGIIGSASQIERIGRCGASIAGRSSNIVKVDLRAGVAVELASMERNFYMTSSCGVCGKASIEGLKMARLAASQRAVCSGELAISAATAHSLPRSLAGSQDLFASTGGLHAAALFNRRGELLLVREDVGRHNALDKLIGAWLLAGRLPADDLVLMLSGRASFELLQKAFMAGIRIVAAVGAPSSLAVDLANELGITLLGFLREDRFNIYSRLERINMESTGNEASHQG